MHTHSQGTRYTVYDDVLPPEDLDLLRSEAARRAVRPTLSAINRFHDGMSFQGTGPAGSTKASIDDLTGPIVSTLAAHCGRAVTGRDSPRAGWEFASIYTAYTAGTQLSWHDDGAGRLGAFIFYLSDWSGDWGGELDILDCPTEQIPRSNSIAESIVAAPVNAVSIFPRPNRLVTLTARTIHRVRRVDPLAGSHARQALSGFIADADTAADASEERISA